MMSYYIHNIPGRLRVKTPFIKGNPDAAEDLQRILSAIEGIDSTSVNTLTGSVVISYDTRYVDSSRILGMLNEEGYVDLTKAVSNDRYLETAVSKAGGVISKALIGMLLEEAFKGSALTLLTALI
jgi:copper chaperone CopZ